MSIFYKFSCEKCGYEENISLGNGGYWYAKVYPQIVSDAVDGKFGVEIQNILKKYPNAAVTYSKVLVKCTNCGKHENILGLSVYLPKDKGFVNENKLVNFFNIDKCYDLVAKFEPKCNFCGGNVEIFYEDNFDVEEITLNCPDCKSLMTGDFGGIWDN